MKKQIHIKNCTVANLPETTNMNVRLYEPKYMLLKFYSDLQVIDSAASTAIKFQAQNQHFACNLILCLVLWYENGHEEKKNSSSDLWSRQTIW